MDKAKIQGKERATMKIKGIRMNLNKEIRTVVFLLLLTILSVTAQEKITPWEKNGKTVWRS